MHHLLQVNVVNDEKQREVKHFLLSAFPKQLVAPGACQRGTTRRATLVNCSKVFCNSTRKLLYGYKDLQRFSLTQSKQSSFQCESLLSILQVHIYNCKIFKIELKKDGSLLNSFVKFFLNHPFPFQHWKHFEGFKLRCCLWSPSGHNVSALFKAEPFLYNKIIIRFDHEFGAHGEISNILEGVGHPGHQPQEAGQEVRFPRATC